MGLRGRIKKLTELAKEGAFLVKHREGSTRVFTVMDVQKEMFLAKCDLVREEARGSPILEVVRQATPETRAAFEAQYGTITPVVLVVAADWKGGWVEFRKLEEHGTATKVRHEGGRSEAERTREAARNRGTAF